MHTAIFTVLLASATMAAADDYYGYGCMGGYTYGNMGGFGGNFRYSDYGHYAGPFRAYPYWFTPYQVIGAAVPVDNVRSKELDRCINELKDLRAALDGAQNKLKDMERREEEAQAKIAELKSGKPPSVTLSIENRLNELEIQLAKKEPQPVKLDDFNKKIDDINKLFADKLKAIEDREKASTIAVLDRIGKHLENQHGNDSKELAARLEEITKLFVITLKKEAPVTSSNIGNGSPTTRSLIVVSLPADATLYLDKHVSKPGSNLRSFMSPELEPGRTYYYTLHVEFERNGKLIKSTPQRVHFQMGREVHVFFDQIDPTVRNELKKAFEKP